MVDVSIVIFIFCFVFFFFSSRRRHTRLVSDWSSDVCSSDLCGGDGNGEEFFVERFAAGAAGEGENAECGGHPRTKLNRALSANARARRASPSGRRAACARRRAGRVERG